MKKIFIIHGWTYTLDGWNACLRELRDLGFEPVMLKVPGLTETSDKVWTLEDYVLWLKDKLAREDNVVLVGHSNGGRIAIAFAAEYPQLVSKLVLVDSAGIVHNELPLRVRRAVFGFAARTGKKFIRSQIARKVLYKIIGAHDYEHAPENMRKTMNNLINTDLVPRVGSLVLPTLIIWGARDKATPLSDAYKIKNLVSSSKLVVIPDAAHSPHMTHPQKVAEEIYTWINTYEK